MPAEFIVLLLPPFCPFERSRHGCDPPDQLIRHSFLPTVFEYKPLLWPSSSKVFTLSLIGQRLSLGEPFLNPFRQTGTPYRQTLCYLAT